MSAATRYILFLLIGIIAAACGDDGRFKVEGTVEGGRTMNLRYVFYNGDAFMQGITAVRDGKFEFEGTAPQPVMIELFDNEYRLLGRLYAAKGDEIKCTLNPSDPNRLRASGRKDLSRWADWLRDNADGIAAGRADSLVAEYAGRNPGDVVSTLLVVTLCDASTVEGLHHADSLLSLIAPEARPYNITRSFVAQLEANINGGSAIVRDIPMLVTDKGRDTLRIASAPLWLLAIGTEDARADSTLPLLRHTDSIYSRRRLHLADLSLDIDTGTWKRITRLDSAKWTQGWLPGGTAARGLDSLAIPVLPFYIVADSAGRQLLRTPSPAAVKAYFKDNL